MPSSEASWIDVARRLAHEVLRPHAGRLDASQGFCSDALRALGSSGLLGMAVPRAYGGLDLHPATQARIFCELAAGCATTAFVVSQHHVVTALLASSPNEGLKSLWLPRLASGEVLGADGINFWRQARATPPMRATPVASAEGWTLDGVLPWVTGARHCQLLVCGALLDDASQLVVALPAGEHLEVGAPQDLLAFGGSQTSSVRLQGVQVAPAQLVLGPHADVLASVPRRGTTYVPTFMALGQARASLEACQPWAAQRGDDAVALLAEVQAELESVGTRAQCAVEAGDVGAATGLRAEANLLVQRAAQLCLALGSGSGYARGALPERLYREAAFWLVWSVGGAILPTTLAAMRRPQASP